jgi:hypothetical protein
MLRAHFSKDNYTKGASGRFKEIVLPANSAGHAQQMPNPSHFYF